jgi:hypothetical protein
MTTLLVIGLISRVRMSNNWRVRLVESSACRGRDKSRERATILRFNMILHLLPALLRGGPARGPISILYTILPKSQI